MALSGSAIPVLSLPAAEKNHYSSPVCCRNNGYSNGALTVYQSLIVWPILVTGIDTKVLSPIVAKT